MRRFSSYGPVDKDLHYYAPRKELIEKAWIQLIGENPDKGGHYITVWAPRQTGKTWLMQQILWRLQKDERFLVLKINLEHLKMVKDVDRIVRSISNEIMECLEIENASVNSLDEFHALFLNDAIDKPLVLILDEFDALAEEAISGLAGVFRNIYVHRQDDPAPSHEKKYLLHGVALIGVRSVLGIENVKGSPFNVQRGLHIPELTLDEVDGMFKWCEKETGRGFEPDVIERIYYETGGQPGLISWLGELLTEGYEHYTPAPDRPVAMDDFEEVYEDAIFALPNNNILNIISKAKQEPYKNLVLEMFQTREKIQFKFDDPDINFLYMNGVVDQEKKVKTRLYLKFSCPFVQKRLFNYFSNSLFKYMGKLHEPFEDLSDTYTDSGLNITNLMKRLQKHLKKNRQWLLEDAPRRKDLRIFEAVYHFNLYRFVCDFLGDERARVYPEFPTGNGKVDLVIKYEGRTYGLEVKSYKDETAYYEALDQAAQYGSQLELSEISLIFFIEYIDDGNREKYEADHQDESTGVLVKPTFVETGA